MKTPPVIEFAKVHKSYQTGPVLYEALRGVSFTICEGEFMAIMGPSGSGKSTIMNLMGALDIPTAGEYRLKGKVISGYSEDELSAIRNQEIGFVFQSFNLLPRTTVLRNVERPMMYAGVPAAQRRERALAALELVGLADKTNNLSNHISGGQIQRVAIARAIVMNPAMILADEPTGNLDTHTAQEIMDFFAHLHQQGRTIILITHEPNIAAYADREIHVKDGLIEADVTKKAKKK